ncbi:MAG: UvrD-helicase domain-containing protein [Candidatus Cloacimonadaceae bacterium]|nr:UvrD-helicase domain-containing protein [Candidatus Cloacimonadaceae bacterium]
MNRVVIACAGARKTTELVNCALQHSNRKVLIVTYTINNYNQIIERIYQIAGHIPPNIEVQTWFTFLLSEGVRPYQNYLYSDARIKSIAFVCGISSIGRKKSDIRRYYLCSNDLIFTDKMADFICEVNKLSCGKVINRLERVYDAIYIDEVQDLAGYDLCVLELLFNSSIHMYVVGDCRQATYYTNQSRKNRDCSKTITILRCFTRALGE